MKYTLLKKWYKFIWKLKHCITGKYNYRWVDYTEYRSGLKLYSWMIKECKVCGYEPNLK